MNGGIIEGVLGHCNANYYTLLMKMSIYYSKFAKSNLMCVRTRICAGSKCKRTTP